MRKLLLLVVVAAVAAFVATRSQRRRWADLTDDEIRDRIHSRLDGRVDLQREAQITDTVLKTMGREPTPSDDSRDEPAAGASSAAS